MHRAVLTALAATVLLQAAAAQPVLSNVEFRPPAQVGGDVGAANATWLLVVFRDGGSGQFDVAFPKAAEDHNITLADLWSNEVYGGSTPDVPLESTQTVGPFSAQAGFSLGASSLYVEADAIQVAAGSTRADVQPKADGACLWTVMSHAEDRGSEARYGDLCPEGDVAAVSAVPDGAQAMDVEVVAQGVHLVEWHHARIACTVGSCPDGGARIERDEPLPIVDLTARVHVFHRLTSSGATLAGSGAAWRVFAGGPVLDVGVDGWVRLPLAQAPPACDGCLAPDGQTLQATGNLTLAGLRPSEDGTMAASLGGNVSWARFDEQSIDPAWLLSPPSLAVAATVGAAVVVLVAWKVLAGLFSRIQGPREALANAHRRALLEAVRAHPGIHFRGLAKAAGLAPSTAEYHLKHLEAHRLIVRRRQGKYQTFFERRGRSEARQRGILEREEALRALHAWMVEAGSLATARIVAHAKQAWGWSSSTAYHRLGRLMQARLVVKASGTLKHLQAVPPTPPFSADQGPQFRI